MTPDEKQQFNKMASDLNDAITQMNDLEDKYNALADLYYRDNLPDRYTFLKDVYMSGKISQSTGQKLGFLGAIPVAQQSAIATPSGGTTIDNQARVAVTLVIQALQKFGFTA